MPQCKRQRKWIETENGGRQHSSSHIKNRDMASNIYYCGSELLARASAKSDPKIKHVWVGGVGSCTAGLSNISNDPDCNNIVNILLGLAS